MCYIYTWSFPAAAATAAALHRHHVLRRRGGCVRDQRWQPRCRTSPQSPPGAPSPRQPQPPPWAALGTRQVKLVCRPQLLHSHRQPKGSDSCSRENTGAATTLPTLGGAATLRHHRLRVKHLLKCPCWQPGAQGRERFFFLRGIESCCGSGAASQAGVFLCCTEVAILMEMSVAVPTYVHFKAQPQDICFCEKVSRVKN